MCTFLCESGTTCHGMPYGTGCSPYAGPKSGCRSRPDAFVADFHAELCDSSGRWLIGVASTLFDASATQPGAPMRAREFAPLEVCLVECVGAGLAVLLWVVVCEAVVVERDAGFAVVL